MVLQPVYSLWGSACVAQDGVLPHGVWEKSYDSTLGVKIKKIKSFFP